MHDTNARILIWHLQWPCYVLIKEIAIQIVIFLGKNEACNLWNVNVKNFGNGQQLQKESNWFPCYNLWIMNEFQELTPYYQLAILAILIGKVLKVDSKTQCMHLFDQQLKPCQNLYEKSCQETTWKISKNLKNVFFLKSQHIKISITHSHPFDLIFWNYFSFIKHLKDVTFSLNILHPKTNCEWYSGFNKL